MPKVIHHIKYNKIAQFIRPTLHFIVYRTALVFQFTAHLIQPISHPVSHRTQLARRTRFSRHIRTSRFLTTASVCALILLLLLTLNLFIPIDLESEKTEAATGTVTASETSLTITSASSVASVDLTVNNSNGTVATSTDTSSISFNVTTNNYTGYTLSISANDDNGLLINPDITDDDNNAITLSSIESATTDFNNTNFANQWGWKPNKLNSVDNNNYLPSPTTTVTTIDETESANATANNYTIALGARADYTKPAGTYTNTFILSLIANPVTYSITYNKNATDTVTNMPYNSNNNVQSGDTSSTSITLSNLTPVRTNYTFLGWCSTTTTTASGTDSCSGTTYNPNGNGTNLTYGIDQATANSTTIYAMWKANLIHFNPNGGTAITSLSDITPSTSTTLPVPDYYRTGYGFLGWSPSSTAASNIASATIYGPNETVDTSSMGGTTLYAVWLKSSGNMQGWTGCSSLTAATYNSSTEKISYTDNTFIALTDTRQSNHGTQVGTAYQDTYAIARLTDGNCWMIENLRLGGSSSISLTTSNTQSAGTLTAAKNSFTIGSSAYTTQQTNATNTLATDSARTANSRYLYGNYYSWAQAINTTAAYSSYSASPQNLSICPSGWRLPLGGGASQYGATNLSYGVLSTSQGGLNSNMTGSTTPTGAVSSARFRTFPNNFVYSGYWNGSSADRQGSLGFYWPTTAYTASSAYSQSLGSTYLYPGTYNDGKYFGSSVRCLQDSKIYMQDLTSSTISTLLPSTGSSATVYDKRDNQAYTIAKLADGKYWMTSNLDLAGGTKLESTNSDVPSGYTTSSPYYTLPASSASGFSSDTTAYVYNSNSTTCGNNSPCYSYYSWLAATAGGKDSSGTAVTGNGYNAAYSVCPKGWKLPTSTTSNANAQTNNNWKTGDWYAFATAYGANLASQYYQNSATFYNNVNGGAAAGKAPVYLLLAGYYYGGTFINGGSDGYYWSRTSDSSTYAYNLSFYSSYVYSADSNNRGLGFSVRCVFGG